jgi:hypothetical protein
MLLLDEEAFQLDPTGRDKMDKHQAAIRLGPGGAARVAFSSVSLGPQREKRRRREVVFTCEELCRIGCLAAFLGRIAACANQFSLTLRCLNPTAPGFHPPDKLGPSLLAQPALPSPSLLSSASASICYKLSGPVATVST